MADNIINIDEESIKEKKESEIPESSFPLKLDYSIEEPEERVKYVDDLLKKMPAEQINQKYLEIMSDYIIFAMDKKERREKKILTDNRLVTVNKRETSFEGLVDKLENGEDGIYGMLSENKNQILTPKDSITQKDIDEIPELQELRQLMDQLEKAEKLATGKRKYNLKKWLIQLHQDQYIIRNSYRQPIYSFKKTKSEPLTANLQGDIYISPEGEVIDTSLISLCDTKHVSELLCNYSKIKEDTWGHFNTDMYYVMDELDDMIEKALKENYPLYYSLLIHKIDGCSNAEIQELLDKEFNITYTPEYISSLWRNKIPKLIADKTQETYLLWFYTYKEKAKWKRCSRCGQIKLAHNRFFSKNSTSKDGYYSICKACRNKKV